MTMSLKLLSLKPISKNCFSNGYQFYRLYEVSSNNDNFKRMRLIKRLASTVLFGGTFLAVVYARKLKRNSSFDECKLVTNTYYHKNFKLYEYKGFILPAFVMRNVDAVKTFNCKDDDIYVASFPKTGTTWIQEIIYCILNGVNNSSNENIEDKFPYLEFIYPGIKSLKMMKHQRLIKTHLPFSLLPEDVLEKKPKIFYVMRNPKDVAVSYYHFVRMMTISDYCGNFENFFEEFVSDKVPYGPVWRHYDEAWNHRNDPNILILNYEDLHKDIRGNILKIASFLNKSITDEEIDKITEHCSFNNMSNNPNVNYQHWDELGIRKKCEAKFMRKGVVGDWKNYFSPDMDNRMNSYIKKHFSDVSTVFSQ